MTELKKGLLCFAAATIITIGSVVAAFADQPTGVGLSTGYSSFWFAPNARDLNDVRPDQGAVATVFTSKRGGGYLRATGTAAGSESGVFSAQLGWDLSPSTAVFVGPSVRYLDDGAIPGFTGTTFALGMAGSVDFTFGVSKERDRETLRMLFAVEGTTRPIEHVATGTRTRGVTISLGLDVANTLFGSD